MDRSALAPFKKVLDDFRRGGVAPREVDNSLADEPSGMLMGPELEEGGPIGLAETEAVREDDGEVD